jgi:hypothetical protein
MLCIAGILLGLAGCAHASPANSAAPAPTAAPGALGYVRMGDLVKKHPLYSQLARLDEDVQAIQLRAVGERIARSGADIAVEQTRLQRELDAAVERTRKALAARQADYAKREQAALAAALGAAGTASRPGAGTIVAGVNRAGQRQAQGVAQTAAANLQAYRQQVVEQDTRALQALQHSLGESAERMYRSKAEQLQKNEADFALQLATGDAAERLSLRTKLSNLALDDAARAQVKARLDALDRKESDALAAMKNRDTATLANEQTVLRDRLKTELGRQAAALRAQTLAKLGRRGSQTRQDLVAQLGSPALAGAGVALPASLPPDLRAKLDALHKKYQSDFNGDANRTIAEFQKTRDELAKRYRELAGIDADAQAGANKQLATLQRQRGELYEQMVAQIESEVRAIAQKRGVNVVLSPVVAPARGIDLTDEAAKDIESLHE